ncbi:hypothetical protein GQ43DRAFT_430317 [Delitschia confertaspora ATCC 74209]|uniref:Uncharacterized protein n=1 Tax=Delitschia confertaspora ATCC 74209 TaxID=1513339 RepID=A0A9P4JPE3_9PLEO|nr:hypothetical protein GQ43DRAFT_430317 [Delitschia confertaspora ATCC 74209]
MAVGAGRFAGSKWGKVKREDKMFRFVRVQVVQERRGECSEREREAAKVQSVPERAGRQVKGATKESREDGETARGRSPLREGRDRGKLSSEHRTVKEQEQPTMVPTVKERRRRTMGRAVVNALSRASGKGEYKPKYS